MDIERMEDMLEYFWRYCQNSMADPWNLTLDQSCFEDWNEEVQTAIPDHEICEVYKQINKLDADADQLELASSIEEKLTVIFTRNESELEDVSSVLPLVSSVSRKLKFFSENTILRTVQTCQLILPKLIQQKNSSDKFQSYFECIGLCLNFITSSEKSLNLMTSIFTMIEYTYNICSKKTLDNSDELFKHSSELLMVALPHVDHQNAKDGSIGKMLKPIIAIGKYSCKLDAKSMALIWKLVLKILQQTPSICLELELDAVIAFLIDEVVQLFDMFQSTSHVSKLTKVSGFLVKVIIGLIELNSEIIEGEQENEAVLNLILRLHRFTADVVKLELPAINDDSIRLLELHLSIAVHPLLNHLVKTKRFWSSLEKVSQSSIESNDVLDLYRLLGLLLTPNYQSNLYDNVCSYQLLELFLCTTDRAHFELNKTIMVNGVIHSGRSAYLVPFYELLVTQACSGIAICQSSAIISCVSLLLTFVCHRGIWSFLMASDILCFMARYGSAQFCLELIQSCFQLTHLANNSSRLLSLINRLMAFLSTSGRTTVLKCYPLEKYPDVWSALSWNCFPADQQLVFQRYFSNLATPSAIKASAIVRLHSLCSLNREALKEQTHLLPNLIKLGHLLASNLNNGSTKNFKVHIECMAAMLVRILLCTVQPSAKDQHSHLVEILRVSHDLMSIQTVQLNVADFLGNMATVGITASAQQQIILRQICDVFCQLLSTPSFVVQQYALRAFEMFFKRTPHSNLTSQSVKDGQESVVSNFIQRKMSTVAVDDLMAFWHSQSHQLSKRGEIILYQFVPIHISDPTDVQNGSHLSIKRPRLEKGNEQLHFLLGNLEEVVSQIGKLTLPFPPWVRTELQQRIETLNSFL